MEHREYESLLEEASVAAAFAIRITKAHYNIQREAFDVVSIFWEYYFQIIPIDRENAYFRRLIRKIAITHVCQRLRKELRRLGILKMLPARGQVPLQLALEWKEDLERVKHVIGESDMEFIICRLENSPKMVAEKYKMTASQVRHKIIQIREKAREALGKI